MAPIESGTDGWGAVIAEDFNFANVARIAQATASLKARNGSRTTCSRVDSRQNVTEGWSRQDFVAS
jgi:phosphomannomutase